MRGGWASWGIAVAIVACDGEREACPDAHDAIATTTAAAVPDDDRGSAAASSSESGEIDRGSTSASDDAPEPDAMPCPEPEADAPVLRVMTFNIRHGAESSLDEIAAVIREHAPDIVALQEVDKEAARSDFVFQSYRLGQLTGTASLFRNALVFPEGGQYGLAILSRFPILASDKVALTSSGEPRVLVIVEVELRPDLVVPIGITHMGLDAQERVVQAQEIVAALGDRPWAILMGDFNARPEDPPIATFGSGFVDAWSQAGRGDGFTFPALLPDRRIDYVMLDEAWSSPADVYVPTTFASDHRPIVAALPFPR
jgi:endonuclease/exonuclease/phosphatase family metal-dependent hydrolase